MTATRIYRDHEVEPILPTLLLDTDLLAMRKGDGWVAHQITYVSRGIRFTLIEYGERGHLDQPNFLVVRIVRRDLDR